MFACCKTPSVLGDIPSNVRVGECPKRKISGFKGAASGEPGKNLVEKSWKWRFKLSEWFWNRYQSIRNQIPDRFSAAEVLITPAGLWDWRFSNFLKIWMLFRFFAFFAASLPSLLFLKVELRISKKNENLRSQSSVGVIKTSAALNPSGI